MSVHVAARAHHTYRANEHDTVLSEVASVQCVLLPRAFLVAGFNESGRVVMARYNSYVATDPAWEHHFFENEFMTEELLGVPQQVKAIFVGSGETMLIPSTLYDDDAARSWMEKLDTICPDDVLHNYYAPSADAICAFALPAVMDKLIHRFFGGTPVLPLIAYQLYKPESTPTGLFQCLLAEDKAIATLHQQGRLLWYQEFPYETVEDIAWKAAQVCREIQILRIDLQIQLTTLCDSCYSLGPELEQYFPKIKWSVGKAGDSGDWAPTVYLLQQLYACALSVEV
jgi:hypothetical protein